MKFSITSVFILILCSSSFAQQMYLQEDGESQFWGRITKEDLRKDSFDIWYQESLESYEAIASPEPYKDLADVQVKLFLGTWCGDSKNWVPKFLQLWEDAGLDLQQVEIIALHDAENKYKQGPNREEEAYGIHRVPTFIFERAGAEIGRIVESPRTSLAVDVAQIAAGMSTEPRYQGVAYLQDLFEQEPSIDSLYAQRQKIANTIYRKVIGLSELNTFAWKLYADGKVEHSLLVLKLNNMLNRFHPYPKYQLGEYYLLEGDLEKSEKALQAAKEIWPELRGLSDMIAKLEEAKKEINTKEG